MNVLESLQIGTSKDLAEALDAGGDPNLCDEHGLSPLFWAVSRDGIVDLDKVRLLLNAGADPNAVGRDGDTAMSAAVATGRMDLIELLREHGASLTSESQCGSLIADAVLSRQLHLIPFLARNGADVNLVSRDGFSPLMLAAGNGVPDAIPALLSVGAMVDLRDSNVGMTAYLHAALVGDAVAARLLLAAGADGSARDSDGETAQALAEANGHDWGDMKTRNSTGTQLENDKNV